MRSDDLGWNRKQSRVVQRCSRRTLVTACASRNGAPGTMVEVDTGISPRVAALKPSKTMAIADKATALAQAGVPVVKLAAGEPDFDTPPAIVEVRHQDNRNFLPRLQTVTST